MNKKIKVISILIVGIIFTLITFNKIKAVDAFDTKMITNTECYYGTGLYTRDGRSLYLKGLKGSNTGSGRAICTSFWDDAPRKGSNYVLQDDWSDPVAAGVAAIIKKARDITNDDDSISDSVYFYAEFATNQFLYSVYKRSVNNANPPSAITSNSNYTQMLTAANNRYSNVNTYLNQSNSDSFKYVQTYFDSSEDLGDGTVKVKVHGSLKCMRGSSTIACNTNDGSFKSSLSASISLMNGPEKIESKDVTDIETHAYLESGTYFTTVSFSAILPKASAEGQEYKYNLNVKETYKFPIAANYYYKSGYQTLTPNKLKNETIVKEKNFSGTDDAPVIITKKSLKIIKKDILGSAMKGIKFQVFEGNNSCQTGEDSNSECSNPMIGNVKCNDSDASNYCYETDESGEISIPDLNVGNTYTVIEYYAPDGYIPVSGGSEMITISSDESKNVLNFVNYYSEFKISKQDISSKKEIPGAELQIIDSRNVPVYSWTSTDEPFIIEGLPDGDYTLVETTAPNGYKKAEEIKFTIEDGKLKDDEDNILVMYDDHSIIDIIVPDTLSFEGIMTIIIGLLLVGCGTGVLIYEIKKQKEA